MDVRCLGRKFYGIGDAWGLWIECLEVIVRWRALSYPCWGDGGSEVHVLGSDV